VRKEQAINKRVKAQVSWGRSVEGEKVSWEKVHTNIMGERREEKEYNHRKERGEAQKYREIERESSKIIVK
jgi:hypothetical protein